jgi:hypothetical protein
MLSVGPEVSRGGHLVFRSGEAGSDKKINLFLCGVSRDGRWSWSKRRAEFADFIGVLRLDCRRNGPNDVSAAGECPARLLIGFKEL